MIISRENNYLFGDCWLFALELNRYMGYELVEYWEYGGSPRHHVLCRTPEGLYIDAKGYVDPPVMPSPWNWQENAQGWAKEWGCAYAETRDYLTFDVETVLYTLGIHYVTPQGYCTLTQLGLKS